MATEWFVQKDGEEHGPYTSNQIREFVSDGQVQPDTQVKQGSDGQWANATRVKGLFPGAKTEPVAIEPVASEPGDFFSQLGGGGSPPPKPASSRTNAAATKGAATPANSPAKKPTRANSPVKNTPKSKKPTLNIAIGVISIAIVVVILLVTSGGGHQEAFEKAVATANKKLPYKIDQVTRLDRYEVGNMVCTAVFTLSVPNPETYRRGTESEVKKKLLEDPHVKGFMKLGSEVNARCLNTAGKKVFEFEVASKPKSPR